MRLEEIEFIDQRALTLIIDVVMLLEQSEITKGTELSSVYARSSITSAALLLECVSNSCLLSLALPAKLTDELDKLPPLAKLDYYLFSVATKHIDRGCRETELAADVLKLRDHVVHPKPKPGALAEVDGEEYVDYGATKALAIPLDNRVWSHETASKVSTVVVCFFKRFFLEWCALDKGRITTLLVTREKVFLQRESSSWVVIPVADHNLLIKWIPDILEVLDLRAKGKNA